MLSIATLPVLFESESGDETFALIRGGVEVTSSRDLLLPLSFPRYRESRPVRRPINHPLTDIPIDKSTSATSRYVLGAEIAKILGVGVTVLYRSSRRIDVAVID